MLETLCLFQNTKALPVFHNPIIFFLLKLKSSNFQYISSVLCVLLHVALFFHL